MQAIKFSQEDTIKMDQSLVHIKHSITILQYKIWYLCLYDYQQQFKENVPKDEDGFYYLKRTFIDKMLGYEISTDLIKSNLKKIRQEPLAFNYTEKNGEAVYHEMGFISEFKVTKNIIKYKFPSMIQKIIQNDPTMFTLLNWNIFNSFTGKYEAIIYKLCKDYVGVGRTPKMTIQEYRDYIGLADSKYKEFKRLSEWTIKNPLKALTANELCDIEITPEYLRECSGQGGDITHLYFTCQYRKNNTDQQEILPPQLDFTPLAAFKSAKISITPEQQSNYLAQYDEAAIQAILERANEYADQLKSSGKPVNYGAIYNKAFLENWGKERLEVKQAEAAAQAEAQIKKAKEIERQKQTESEKAAEDQKYEQAIQRYEALPDAEKQQILSNLQSTSAVGRLIKKAIALHGVEAHHHNVMLYSLIANQILANG